MNEMYRDQMAARGWEWDEEVRSFRAAGGQDRQGCPVINLRVSERDSSVWMAHYGTPGIGYESFKRQPTPMAAADEAEAWLREVLAPLRLPWLTVAPGGAR